MRIGKKRNGNLWREDETFYNFLLYVAIAHFSVLFMWFFRSKFITYRLTSLLSLP
jgi:hypothetical protein